jgi:hypothetical protein
MGLVRRAGTGRTADGDLLRWVVADGRRGRRWRETLERHDGIRHSLLLETGPDAEFTHLELASVGSLLTLHPEGDGTLHGNLVDAGGVRHVAGWPWADDGVIDLEASAVTGAAAVRLLGRGIAPGSSVPCTRLRILAAGGIAPGGGVLTRVDLATWRLADGPPFRVDADGLPVLDDAQTWPLEADLTE